MTLHQHTTPLPNWAIPAFYVVVAVVAGLVLPRLEARLFPGSLSSWSASATLAIFSAIASGMISMTGIVFALAFLMVQFSATAYSPRLVRWLARNPLLWHAVGVFSATFIYALAAIGWVERSSGGGGAPFFSSWIVIVMLLASVGTFIALIDRLSLLQLDRTLAFTADQGRRVIEQLYPLLEDGTTESASADELAGLVPASIVRHWGRPSAVQVLDLDALLAVASKAGAVVAAACAVGDTLVEGTPMLRVYGGAPIDENALRRTFSLGSERTFEQDPKYAIRLLVDIAIRALSPAINDPTTAVQALDQIEDLLLRLGRRRLDIGGIRDRSGALRVVVPVPTWDDFIILAFDEIRFCGATSVQVMRRMRALAVDLIQALPPERHPALAHYRSRLDATIAQSFSDAEDRKDASVEDRQGLGVPRTR
jgi:uncharacterized membrane protein